MDSGECSPNEAVHFNEAGFLSIPRNGDGGPEQAAVH